MKTRKSGITIGVFIIVLLLIVFCVDHFNQPKRTGVIWKEETQIKKSNTYITIPGFSEIFFNADDKIQKFKFHNPESNHCIMDIEFYLPDNEMLFSYQGVEPNYGITEVELNNILPEGEYRNCYLVIKCYSSDGTLFNGATMNVDLHVR